MQLEYALDPGFYQWRGDHLVRLNEQYRSCVVLIGTAPIGSDDEIAPWGTAFFVGDCSPRGIYLVTAAHVVADKADAPFQIRFNVKGGGARNFTVQYPNWVFHPTDDTVDVAVHEIKVPDWADAKIVPKKPNLTMGKRFEKKDIGAGSRTYTIGLWQFLHGKRRNQNFVYTGHIGLIPDDEKIPVNPWLPGHGDRVQVEAYLVEGEPLQGASGSPVFVRRTIPFTHPKYKKTEAHVEGSVWLLGLQSDAFVGRPGEDYKIPTGDHRVVIPRGVNVVVPVEKIIEVLDHPVLVETREEAMAKAEAEKMPVKTGSAPPTKDKNPQHKEDFNSLLGAAVRNQKQDDQT